MTIFIIVDQWHSCAFTIQDFKICLVNKENVQFYLGETMLKPPSNKTSVLENVLILVCNLSV